MIKKVIFFICFIILFLYCASYATYKSHLAEIGTSQGRAVTDTLYVSPNGSGVNGQTWATAYTTIQAALAAASTDADDLTLIYIAPHETYYDIDATGDPTYTGNYILRGSHRNWAKIKNTHAGATSILKFTGKTSLIDLNFNLGSGSGNGVILTHGGWRVYFCQFVGEDLTGAAIALEISNGTTIKHGKIEDCYFKGHTSYMTAIKFDNVAYSHTKHVHIYDCLKAVHIEHADSDNNVFHEMDFDDNALALDLDAGNRTHFTTVNFDGNTENVDDEVGDHIFEDIRGEFIMCLCPDDLSGVDLTADNVADTYGEDIEVRAAATATKPFKIVGYVVELDVAQKYEIRLSADSGSTFFDYILMDTAIGVLASVTNFPSGTEFIFNKDTRISASVKAESGGEDTCKLWLKIQQI